MYTETWQTEVHQQVCADHYFVGCLDQTYVLCFATWLLFCVSMTGCSWPTILISVCLCDGLQMAYYTYFCMSLWLTAVDLLYLFLYVSVTDCSWPTIPISGCLCDWLQLAYYTCFCVSLWQIVVDLLYVFLCLVTDCSWPTIPVSVCLCDRLHLTYCTYFCMSLWLQLAPVQGFPIPEIDSKSQQFLTKHRLELLDKKRLLQQVQQNPWLLLLL